MSGPWEKYQPQAEQGPWTKYQAQSDAPTIAAALAARRERIEGQGYQIVMEIGDGFVYRAKSGELGYTSPGYSTTDKEAITRIIRENGPRGVIQSGFDQEALSQHPIAARVNEIQRGAPFVGSYLDDVVGAFSPRAGQAMRGLTGAMQRERPGETLGFNLAGGLAYSAPFAIAAAPGVMAAAPKSLGARVAAGIPAGATAGAVEGTVYGAGEGTGEERIANMKGMGGIGAAFGAVLGGAGPFAATFFDVVARRFKGSDVRAIAREFGISTDAAKILRKAFLNNDKDAAAQILRAGPDATLADASVAGRALLDASAQTGGTPLAITREAVEGRAQRALDVTNKGLDDALGPVRPPIAAAREISSSTAPARQSAYDAAYATPIDYADDAGRGIEAVLARIDNETLNAAVKEARAQMLADGHVNKQIMAEIADDGRVTFTQMPDVMQLDYIKRALDDLGADNVDNFGRQTSKGRRYRNLAGDLRDAIVSATGGDDGVYARALAEGGNKIEMDRGLQLGLEMLSGNKTTREMVANDLRGMTQDAREMVKVGLRAYIDDVLARTKMVASDANLDAREAMAALRMLSSRDARDKLRILIGPEFANTLLPQIERAASALEMRAAVSRNSATAVRTAIQGEARDIMEPGVVGTAMRGKPIDATSRAVQGIMATTPGDDALRREAAWTDVARVLTERRGSAKVQLALNFIEKALAGQPLTEAQSRLIANELATSLLLAGNRTATQALSLP